MRCTFDEYRWEDPETQYLHSFDQCGLGLLAVSRQLHAETAFLPYQLGLFLFKFKVSKGK